MLVRKGVIFNPPTYVYVDASETRNRSYAAFLSRIPSDYRGAAKITYVNGRLHIYEHGGRADRTLTIDARNLFPE